MLGNDQDATTFAQHGELLDRAWINFQQQAEPSVGEEYRDFIAGHDWLGDYALFMAIREQQSGRPWTHWPAGLRDRDVVELARVKNQLSERIGFHQFAQFIFFRQWQDLRGYAKQHGVLLFGDLPIYVSQDSADVWVNRDLFLLDNEGEAEIVAGVPPDYFSEDGQRWGNPQYDWEAMQLSNFSWWKQRMHTQFELFDLVRIDHFRGLQAYWEIPAEEETAINGRWVAAPGEDLLKAIHDDLNHLDLVAEDLGIITEEVTALRGQFGLPGMKVLQFAFDGDPGNAYLPHNHEFNSVVYTGTHDNDTTLGWFSNLDNLQAERVYEYLGAARDEAMPWPLIRASLASTCCLAVLPMQDVLELGQGHRMNTPGTMEDNWRWRFDWSQVTDRATGRLYGLCQLYDR